MSEDLKWCGFTFDAGGDEATCHLGLPLQVRLLLLVFLRRQTLCLKAIWCLFFPLTISPFHTNMMELIAKDQHADIVKNRLKMLLVETDCLHCPSCKSYRAKHNTTALQPCIWKRHFPNNINLKKKKVWGAKSYVNILWSKSFFFIILILFWTNN